MDRNSSPVFLLSACDSGNDAMGTVQSWDSGMNMDGLNVTVPPAVSPILKIMVGNRR